MPKAPVYNSAGQITGEIELAPAVFAIKPKPAVIHQVYVAQMANARAPWAHTKQRGEVRGGGKKPWKQKGTGRARHGSIRSPIWRGGGVVFGPRKIENYQQKVNQKMRQLAVRMCLSDKAGAQRLVVAESFPSQGKTKELAAWRSLLPGNGKSTILLSAADSQSLRRAAQNLSALAVQRAADVSVVDLLHHQYVIMTKESVAVLETRLAVKKV